MSGPALPASPLLYTFFTPRPTLAAPVLVGRGEAPAARGGSGRKQRRWPGGRVHDDEQPAWRWAYVRGSIGRLTKRGGAGCRGAGSDDSRTVPSDAVAGGADGTSDPGGGARRDGAAHRRDG